MTDNTQEMRKVSHDGLWANNVGLVQLLGLCPLMAVSSTVINSLGLGIATTAVLVASNASVSSIRHYVRPELRIPVFVLVIASLVTIVEQLIKANFYELFLVLGIFLPLITTNCAVIARAEAYASKHSVGLAALDGLMMGVGFCAVLVVLGAIREALGLGTLLVGADQMFGEHAKWLTITLVDDYPGFLLAILPPGAFFALGVLIAIKNKIDARMKQQVAKIETVVVPVPAQSRVHT